MKSRSLFAELLAISVLWQMSGPVPIASAVLLSPGDIVIADSRGQGTLGLPAILKVDPQTGFQTIISMGDLLIEPGDVAFSDGFLFAVDTGLGGPGRVVKIDPSTGDQTLLWVGVLQFDPRGISTDLDGSILVPQGNGASGELVRIDPVTGNQTVISSGGGFLVPFDVVVNLDGDYVVSDRGPVNGTGSVFIVDRDTGAQTVLATGGNLINPRRLDLDAAGNILLMDSGLEGGSGVPKIIRINSSDGAQTVISSGGLLRGQEVGLLLDGRLLSSGPNILATVDPLTGDQTLLSSGGQFVTAVGFDIVPIPEPSAFILAAIGFALVGWINRRGKRSGEGSRVN